MRHENEKIDINPTDMQDSENKDDIFQIEEIKIEEMAIDGICGVY
jgi:mycofactocin precursor